MSIQGKTETEKIIESRIEEHGIGLSPEEACKKKSGKASTTAIIVLCLLLGTTIPLGIGLSYGMESIIDINIDMTNMVVSPNATIKVELDIPHYGVPPTSGKYASTDNATFIPYSMFVGILYPRTARWFANEFTFSQIPSRLETQAIYSDVTSLETVTDFYVGCSTFQIYLDKNVTYNIKLRVSSDYQILVKTIMYINFTDPSEEDQYVSFVYSEGHGTVDYRGKPLGKTAFPLEKSKTTLINITGFYYDYQYIDAYFFPWESPYDIPCYPFILNGTRDVRFDWNNFWRVHD